MRSIPSCLRGQPQETWLNIKCARPIYVVSFETVKIIAVLTSLAALLGIIYCIAIFISAIKISLRIGLLINMISKNEGNVLPTLFALPALGCLIINIAMIYLIYLAFRPKVQKLVNWLMYILILVNVIVAFIIFVVCIVILAHVYASNEQMHNGIIDAMRNYSSESDIKEQIDNMQIEFQCCGSKKYDEWYDIEWYDINMVKSG